MADALNLGGDIVQFVTETTGRSKVSIVGKSMWPLLRAGMVVEVENISAELKIGDIVVYKHASRLVAHRLIARVGTTGLITAGDAYPENREWLGRLDVIGRVSAVWSNATPKARRVDGPMFRLAGAILARTRSFRATCRLLAGWLRYFVRPPSYEPAFRQMIAASTAFERGDFAVGIAQMAAVPTASLQTAVLKHGMSGLFFRWLTLANSAGYAVDSEWLDHVQKIRWMTAFSTKQVVGRAMHAMKYLSEGGVEAILLKGGGRLCAGEPDADLHGSGDVDVLVPAERVDEAVSLLRAAGYRERATAREMQFYKQFVHHRAPLWPPKGNVPIEVHTQLTLPGSVSATLNFHTLFPLSRISEGPHGAVRTFDDVGSALHLAYHARDFHIWRDVVLLSRYLRRMSPEEQAKFNRLISNERRDRTRLYSVVEVARSLIAPIQLSGSMRRYISWAIIREDFPDRLKKRTGIMDAWYAKLAPYYRGARHTVGSVPRWIYNVVATPIILRWLRWGERSFGPSEKLFGQRYD